MTAPLGVAVEVQELGAVDPVGEKLCSRCLGKHPELTLHLSALVAGSKSEKATRHSRLCALLADGTDTSFYTACPEKVPGGSH